MTVQMPRLSRDSTDWLKGLLIIVVMLDHNDYLRALWPDLMKPMTLHVLGFFVLNAPGTYADKSSLVDFTKVRIVRYGWPFVVFYTFYCVSSWVFGGTGSWSLYLQGLLTGTFYSTKQGGAGAFMWFLPALLGFSILVKLSSYLKLRNLLALVLLCVGLQFVLPGLGRDVRANVPLGLHVALYIAPFVFAFYAIHASRWYPLAVASGWRVFGLLAFVTTATYAVLVRERTVVEVGAVVFPLAQNFDLYLINGLHMMGGLLCVWMVAQRVQSRCRLIGYVGANSLVVYLVHPLCYKIFAVLLALALGAVDDSPVQHGALLVASFAFALLLALGVAALFNRFPRLRALVFPRDGAELSGAMKFR